MTIIIMYDNDEGHIIIIYIHLNVGTSPRAPLHVLDHSLNFAIYIGALQPYIVNGEILNIKFVNEFLHTVVL